MRWNRAIPLLITAFAVAACNVEQTREGELPEVEVTDPGQLPAFDVDPADVDVTTDTQVVEVPQITTTERDTVR